MSTFRSHILSTVFLILYFLLGYNGYCQAPAIAAPVVVRTVEEIGILMGIAKPEVTIPGAMGTLNGFDRSGSSDEDDIGTNTPTQLFRSSSIDRVREFQNRQYNDMMDKIRSEREKADVKSFFDPDFLRKTKYNDYDELFAHVNSKLFRLGITNDISSVGLTWYGNLYSKRYIDNDGTLKRFNETFRLPAHTLWGSISEDVCVKWNRKLNRLPEIKRTGHDNADICYLGKGYSDNIFKYLAQEGNTFCIVSTQFKNDLYDVSELYCVDIWSYQLHYSGDVATAKHSKVHTKYLYISGIYKNGVIVVLDDLRYFVSLSKENPVQDLIRKISPLFTGSRKIILELDKMQQSGLARAGFETPLINYHSHKSERFFDPADQPTKVGFINPTYLLHELGKLKGYEFYLGSDIVNDASKVNALPVMISRSDAVLLVPQKSFSKQDELITSVLEEISETGLRYTIVDQSSEIANIKENNVLVLSGHNGKNLWGFLHDLGERHLLEGKILIMYSCNDPNDIFEYSNLIRKYKAKVVLKFPDKINPNAVTAVLLKIGNHLDGDFRTLWKMAAQAAYDDPSPSFRSLREDIKKLAELDMQGIISFEYREYFFTNLS